MKQAFLYALLIVTFPLTVSAGDYRFAVEGEQLRLNGKPFKIIGLRLSNALITEADTQELIDHLDEFKSYGVNSFSVFVMGSRFGDVKGYLPNGQMNPVYQTRLARIIKEADRRGMVVLVGCLYWGESHAKDDLSHWQQADANRAVANTAKWLSDNNYRNVFVDPDNEGMAHKATGWSIAEMIDAAHAVDSKTMVAYNWRDAPPDNADLLVHFSPKVKGRPYVDSEGTPENAPGGYWHDFSRRDGYRNYLRLGRYTPEMKESQFEITHRDIDQYAGHMLASTYLQASPAEAIGGPFMNPGGRAENPAIDDDVTALQDDAGILWWLEHIRERYGPWVPPVPGS